MKKTAAKRDQANSSSTQELIQGVISRISFRNSENGFCVLKLKINSSDSTQTEQVMVGVLPPELTVGSHVIARGVWQTHDRFGKQFRAYNITETNPSSKDAIERYLASGTISGFGPVLAERVVAHFGEKTVEVLDSSPERLLEVPGLGQKKLAEISESWQANKRKRETMLFFHSHEIPAWLAERIVTRYGDRAVEVVKKNPYLLAREMSGVGFLTADRLGAALGIEPNSAQRLEAGIAHCLTKALDDGHCYLPRDELLHLAARLLDVSEEDLLESALAAAIAEGMVIAQDTCIYLPQIYQAEITLANAINAKLRTDPSMLPQVPEQFEYQLVNQPVSIPGPGETSKTISLSKEQTLAVHLARTQPLLVITGGPGCGKTTVVQTITRMFELAGKNIGLTAPTGRAAQRLAEVCGLKAQTIHRLLKFDPQTRDFLHGPNEPLEYDVVIADESSMIDIQLASSLFSAIGKKTRVIIVGDADQLPSVGPGLFLADLLATPSIARVRLNQLFRRDDESSINQIAFDINHAQVPNIPEPDGKTKSDAYFLSVSSTTEAQNLVEKLVADQVPKKFGYSGSEITVLSPMNQGELGVIALNERLQNALRPKNSGLPSLKVGKNEYRLGDRVCQRVNNYQLAEGGVFNGDQGEVVSVDTENKALSVKLWDGRLIQYTGEALDQLDLAYAISIHRSQGSEVPVVILVLHNSHYIMLERQLLYTAVTRAKKLLIVVGTRKAIARATTQSRSQKRYTGLGSRIVPVLKGRF